MLDDIDLDDPPAPPREPVEDWQPIVDGDPAARPRVMLAVPRPASTPTAAAPPARGYRGKVVGGAVLTALIVALAAAQAAGGAAVVLAGAGVGGAAAVGGAVYGARKLRRRLTRGRTGRIRPGKILGRGPGLGLGLGGGGGGLIPKPRGKAGRGGLLGAGSTPRRGGARRATAGFGSTPRVGGRGVPSGRRSATSGTTGGTRFAAPRRAAAAMAHRTGSGIRRAAAAVAHRTGSGLRRVASAAGRTTGVTATRQRWSARRDQIRQRRQARRDTKWKARYQRRDQRRLGRQVHRPFTAAFAAVGRVGGWIGRRLRRDLWTWLGSVVRALIAEQPQAALATPAAPPPAVPATHRPSPRPRRTPRPQAAPFTIVRTMLPAVPDLHDDDIDSDGTGRPGAAVPTPRSAGRSTTMHPAHERALEAYREAIGGWEPENLPDTDGFLASFGELYRGMAEVNSGLGDRLRSETPVDMAVSDYLHDTGGGLTNMGDGGDELHQIWRSANAKDIQRHEDGRPHEELFDVGRA